MQHGLDFLPADAITCCKISRAGRHAASGGVTGELKLWGLAEGAQLHRQQHGHAGPVTAIAFLEPAVVSGALCGAKCWLGTSESASLTAWC